MNQGRFLRVSGTIFLLIGVLHLARAALGLQINVNGAEFPIWASLLGGPVFLALGLWAFRLVIKR